MKPNKIGVISKPIAFYQHWLRSGKRDPNKYMLLTNIHSARGLTLDHIIEIGDLHRFGIQEQKIFDSCSSSVRQRK